MRRRAPLLLTASALMLACGCQLFVDDADRQVYSLVRQRQAKAIGIESDIDVGAAQVPGSPPGQAYDFVPSPIGPEVPDAFKRGVSIEELTQQAAQPDRPSDPVAPAGERPEPEDEVPAPEPAGVPPGNEESDAQPPQERPADDSGQTPAPLGAGGEADVEPDDAQVLAAEDVDIEHLDQGAPMRLSEALAYAVLHARQYQDAKEDLYLRALDLTLERHLWTPLFVSRLSADYTEFPDERFRANPDGPDRALDAVADFAVTQRLPYGGEVVAQWIGTMMRDLENHVTTGESGAAILSANIPLLRGAGPTAYESRYQAERDLIYAVRDFERFRREFLTEVANSYFDLLSGKTNIRNAVVSRDSNRDNYLRSQAMVDAEMIPPVDANRARVSYLNNSNRVVAQIQGYQTQLDRFKILIGMSIEESIDVVDEQLDLHLAEVDEKTAIETALATRLELITVRDRLDDAARRVEIAKNGLLPDLAVRGQVRWGTQPDHLSMFDFREDFDTWTLGVDLDLPLDRTAERNALRAAMIGESRAERALDLAEDQIRLEVRDALRTIGRTRASLELQAESVRTNEVQREIAELRFRQGTADNRDLVDADDALLDARDLYSQELSNLRQAVLNLRLQTGTLRVDDEGQWVDF